MMPSTAIRHQSVERLSGRVGDDERHRLCVLRASGTGYMTGFLLYNHLLLVCCQTSLPALVRNQIVANSLEGEPRSQVQKDRFLFFIFFGRGCGGFKLES